MSDVTINSSALGTQLMSLLNAQEIEPGSDPSYQLCKIIYLYHPLGGKMVDKPIMMAQSQHRKLSVPKGPEERVVEAFTREWAKLKADIHIAAVMTSARIYGIGSIVYGAPSVATDTPIDLWSLSDLDIYFNNYDPLNTAGSLVLNQNPNAPDFQKVQSITAAGQPYHVSRSCTVMNERPIYIAFTTSAFGFAGRSVYQRALFPLKSYVQSMITDDLVTLKAGAIVSKMKPAGSIINNLMAKAAGIKRALLREAQTGNVFSIDPDESIETLDLNNVNQAMAVSRSNILENIASAAAMPAKILNNETFAEGFGEGSEDAKEVALFVDNIRNQMQPLYDFFDKIVQHRAWNEEFYQTIQNDFPEYAGVDYKTAFYDWVNSFSAEWPSYLIEPKSESVKNEDTKLRAIISILEVLMPQADPENKARVVQWAADNINADKCMFTTPLVLDIDALASYEPQQPAAGSEPSPEGMPR